MEARGGRAWIGFTPEAACTLLAMRTLDLGFRLAACSLVVFACGAGDDPVSPEQACDEAAAALCSKLEECAPFLVKSAFADTSQCIARFKINCPSSFTAPGTSATPEQLVRCASDVKATSCDDVVGRNYPESCRTAPGTLEDGAVCGHDAQCKNGLCRRTDNTGCGACSSLGSAGADCKRDEDCDYGLACHQQKCVAFGKAGDPCSPTQPCLPTLGCNEGRCAPPLAPGAACRFVRDQNACDLAKGYYCHPTAGVCSQAELSPPGGTCEFSLERIAGCAAGATCKIAPGSTTGSCEAVAADGAPCNDESGPKCLAPARCIAGVCTILDPATCK